MKALLILMGVLNIFTGCIPPIDVLSYLNFATAAFCFIVVAVTE